MELVSRSGAAHTANAPHLKGIPGLAGTVLDCEATAPSGYIGDTKSILGSLPETSLRWQQQHGWLQLVVFDVLRYKDVDVTGAPLSVRRDLLEGISLPHSYSIEPVISYSKLQFYKNIVLEGGEGVVIKRLSDSYQQGKRRWLKLKKHETWDVVVIGFTQGQGKYADTIGALVYGAYDSGKLVTIGSTSGMTDDERYLFSSNPDCYLNRVAVIEGMEIAAQGAIRHPRFLGFRDDKRALECTVETFYHH